MRKKFSYRIALFLVSCLLFTGVVPIYAEETGSEITTESMEETSTEETEETSTEETEIESTSEDGISESSTSGTVSGGDAAGGTVSGGNAGGLTLEEKIQKEFEELWSTPDILPETTLFGNASFSKVGDTAIFTLETLPSASIGNYLEGNKPYSVQVKDSNNYEYIVCSTDSFDYWINKDIEKVADRYGTYLHKLSEATLEEILIESHDLPLDTFMNFAINPTQAGSLDEWKNNLGSCYLLVFKSNASSLDDLIYKIPFNKVPYYSTVLTSGQNEEPDDPANLGSIESVLVTLGSPIKDIKGNTMGYNINVSYSLVKGSTTLTPRYFALKDNYGAVVAEYRWSDTSDNLNGSITLNADKLQNITYNYEFSTNTGLKTNGTLSVTGIHNYDDEIIPYDPTQAVVTISELPSSAYLGDTVTLYITTSIPCKVNFGGESLSNDYATSFEVKLYSNCIASYSAITKSGVVTEGKLNVNIFVPRPSQTEAPFVVVETNETKLTQTGIEDNWYKYFSIGFLSTGLCAVAVVLYRKKKGVSK